MTGKYRAPDLATKDEWSRESGVPPYMFYKLVESRALPHVRFGSKGIRACMPAFRKMVAGEAIAAELLQGKPLTLQRTESEAP